MDLLAGYGSDGGSDSEPEALPAPAGRQGAGAAARSAAPPPAADPSPANLLARLPAPAEKKVWGTPQALAGV